MLSFRPVADIAQTLETDFARIFGGKPVPIIAVSFGPEEQNLDPASQTGDFAFPRDLYALEQIVSDAKALTEMTGRVLTGTATDADRAKLNEVIARNEQTESDKIVELKNELGEALVRENNLIAELEGDSFDLTHEEVRIYHFPDGVEVEVCNPHTLTIGADGTHYITPFDRVGIEVPPRWVRCEVFPKQDEACFDGHPSVNEVG